MSPAAVNGLVLSFAALLALLLAVSLIVVIRLPSWPALDPAAKRELDARDARFGEELRKRARASAGRRGKEVSKKDIRAEYRELRIRRTATRFSESNFLRRGRNFRSGPRHCRALTAIFFSAIIWYRRVFERCWVLSSQP